MLLILARHGKASPFDDTLTKKGEDETEILAEKLHEIVSEEDIPIIITSPATRAKKTAEIFLNVLGGNVVERDYFGLRGVNTGKMSSIIRASFRRHTRCVVVVTHEPHIKSLFKEIVSPRWPEISMKEHLEWGAHVIDLETGEYTPLDAEIMAAQ